MRPLVCRFPKIDPGPVEGIARAYFEFERFDLVYPT